MKVREVLRLLTDDGWGLVAQKGSHRQLKHPLKPGKVTVPGNMADEVPPDTQEHLAPSWIGELSMNKKVPLALDLEQERQQRIDELMDQGPHWIEQYKPGSFGCHELLDRTSLVADLVEQQVLSHPACLQNRDWFALAEQAVTVLRELYQQIGAAHLEDKSEEASVPLPDLRPH